jgi:valyl-tRNA synthetase
LFDDKLCEQGRNFCNKVWNAFRLVKGWEIADAEQPAGNVLAIKWFNSKISQVVLEVQDHFSKFRISDALLSIYNLIWDDFCGQYLEIIKPAFGSPIDQATYDATIGIFEKLMALAHPYMPFITEEIWQAIAERQEGESICRAAYPVAGEIDIQVLADFEILFGIVSKVRETRNTKQISPKTELPLAIKTEDVARYKQLESIIVKLANTFAIEYVSSNVENAISFVLKADEFFISLEGELDVEAELANATKELEYNLGFKKSVEAKLSNERFVNNAKPDVVEKERQKLADAESKIKALEETIARLKAM